MRTSLLLLVAPFLIVQGCKKSTSNTNTFVKYTIQKGAQASDNNGYKKVDLEDMRFVVKFDSSAIYRTVSTSNQVDINKLYGFSDNNGQHQENSARVGWRWRNDSLQLFAYVYNNSVMLFKQLGAVKIGSENNCAIKVAGTKYTFTLNGVATEMPRASTTAKGNGYKLYPYFGGNEPAPHTISIWIKEL